jgi:hypothetical protein
VNEEKLDQEILKGIGDLPDQPERSLEMKTALKALLNIEPSNRPSTRDLLLSPFFEQLIGSLKDHQQMRLHRQILVEASEGSFFEARSGSRKHPRRRESDLTGSGSRGPEASPSLRRRRSPSGSSDALKVSAAEPTPSSSPRGSSSSSKPLLLLDKKTNVDVPVSYSILAFPLFLVKVAYVLLMCGSEVSNPIFSIIYIALSSINLLYRPHDNQVSLQDLPFAPDPTYFTSPQFESERLEVKKKLQSETRMVTLSIVAEWVFAILYYGLVGLRCSMSPVNFVFAFSLFSLATISLHWRLTPALDK